MDVQLFDLSWVICFTICGLRIGRPYFMSVFYSTTLLLVLSFCCLFVPSSFSPHFVYTLSVFFNLSIVNLVLVTSELLGTTDPGCNRIGLCHVWEVRPYLLSYSGSYIIFVYVGRCRSSGSICFCGDSVWQQRQSYSCELTVGQIFLHHWHGAAIVTQLSGRSLPMNACSRLVVAYLHLFEHTV